MKVSLICIKKIKELEDCRDDLLNRYINFFKIGNIYEFEIEVDNLEIEIEDKDFFSYFDYKNCLCFHKCEIEQILQTL